MTRNRLIAAVPVGLLALSALVGCRTNAKQQACGPVVGAACATNLTTCSTKSCGDKVGHCGNKKACGTTTTCGKNACGLKGRCADTACAPKGCATKSGCGRVNCGASLCGTVCSQGDVGTTVNIVPNESKVQPVIEPTPEPMIVPEKKKALPQPPVIKKETKAVPAPAVPEKVKKTFYDARRVPADRLQVLHRQSQGVPVIVANGQPARLEPIIVSTPSSRRLPVETAKPVETPKRIAKLPARVDVEQYQAPAAPRATVETNGLSRQWSDALGLPETPEQPSFNAWAAKQREDVVVPPLPKRVVDLPRTNGVQRN